MLKKIALNTIRNDEMKKTVTLPYVAGIDYQVETFDLTASSFSISGLLTIRNQVVVSLDITYSNEVEYLYNDDDSEDAYYYVTHIIDESSLRIDCQLVGDDTSLLKAHCTHPIVLEAIQTSTFLEQLLSICKNKFLEEKFNSRFSYILQLFLEQPFLSILLFYNWGPVCFDIYTKPIYIQQLKTKGGVYNATY